MTDTKIPLADRLNERSFVDRWGFIVFASIGSLLIFLSKYQDIDPIIVAAGATAIMLLYAALVQFGGTGRLRSDQAGDNCYYLGLIYTLTSLAYAIFTFDPVDTATTIVQGFGIALATTITGLILRVFFSQSRVDLTETEDSARVELASAAGHLKAELSQAVVSMSDFTLQMRQSIEELRTSVVSDISTASAAAISGMQATSTAAVEAISAHSVDMSGRAKRLAISTDRIVASMEKQSDGLAALGVASEQVRSSLSFLKTTTEATQESVAHLHASASALAATQSGLHQASEALNQSVSGISTIVREFEAVATRFGTSVDERIAAVGRVPAEFEAESVMALRRLTASFQDEVAALLSAHRQSVERSLQVSTDVIASIENHNAALESELARSRANVGKVHAALVDMTSELISQVKGSTPT